MPSNERSAKWLRGAVEAMGEATGARVNDCWEPKMSHQQQVARWDHYRTLLAAAEAREAGRLTKDQWIARYGGQAVLDREGFDVVPCVGCKDPICHGWMVKRKTEATQPTAAECELGTYYLDQEVDGEPKPPTAADQALSLSELQIKHAGLAVELFTSDSRLEKAAEVIEACRVALGQIQLDISASNWRADCDHVRSACSSIGCNGQQFRSIEAVSKTALALCARWKEANGG